MIRSVGHTPTKAWHRSHTARNRRAILTLLAAVAFALLLATTGYFSHVSWEALGSALLHTTYRLALAYVVALVVGVTLALLVGWSPFSDALFPVFDILQNIPSFALIPVFIHFLGFTDKMIILFAMSSIIWPILFAVLTAIKSVHKDLNDAATIFGATGLKRIPNYLGPLAFPAALTGSVVGIAIGWESVIGAEIIGGTSGFGAFIAATGESGINAGTVAGMLGILIIVFVINRIVWAPLLAESAKRYAE